MPSASGSMETCVDFGQNPLSGGAVELGWIEHYPEGPNMGPRGPCSVQSLEGLRWMHTHVCNGENMFPASQEWNGVK